MKLKQKSTWIMLFVFLFVGLLAIACAANSEEGTAVDGTDHAHENDGDEHDRVPNNGAAVRILSPSDGATFKVGDEIPVEIELENFELGDGNHWHIFVDGSSWGMVMGENTDDVVRGLEAGEHEIAVYLSIDTHEELEDGDAIMIVVEE